MGKKRTAVKTHAGSLVTRLHKKTGGTSLTEAVGQGKAEIPPLPGTKAYKRRLEKLLDGRLTYDEFLAVRW